MKEKGVMYYRKVKGELDEEEGRRLVKVGRKVKGMRRKLKKKAILRPEAGRDR